MELYDLLDIRITYPLTEVKRHTGLLTERLHLFFDTAAMRLYRNQEFYHKLRHCFTGNDLL